MKFDVLSATLAKELWAVDVGYAGSVIDGIDAFRRGEDSPVHNAQANNSVTLQNIGSVAVIAIDGAMYKKDISGACESVVAYTDIDNAINQAENDRDVDTILFRVDTPGGSISGADGTRSKIQASPKKTITYFENLGASAGMWIFTACDELYASETTSLGSIGVIAMAEEVKDDKKVITILSKNAPNKTCDIKDDSCRVKLQNRIDHFEGIFFDRLTSRFGKDKETIKTDFDDGGVVFAPQALENGYLDGVMNFQELINSIPSMGQIVKQSMIVDKPITGEHMTVEEQLETANSTIGTMQSQIDEKDATIATLEARATLAIDAVAMGMELGASKDTILLASKADTKDGAELVIRRELKEDGKASYKTDDKKDPKASKEPDYMSHAEQHKGSIR